MKSYKYIIKGKNGKKDKGTVKAETKTSAIEGLRRDGVVILSVAEDKASSIGFLSKPMLSFQEKMMFTKHMTTMIEVGIPIVEALDILKGQTTNPNNKRMYDNIISLINSGQSLAKSLGEYKSVFSEVFVNMVETGEESGTLEKVFKYLDVQLEKEYVLKKRIISAFVYPVLIITMTLMLTFGIVIFVMPRITKIFSSFDVVLPLPTRIMIGFSSFITGHPIYSFLIFTGFVGLSIFFLRAKFMQRFWSSVVLRIPVFGKLMVQVNLARFARTMGSLLQAGVPITRSLEITANMYTNYHYKAAILDAYDKVKEGGKMGEAFAMNTRLFPLLVSKMLSIGEKTGSLEGTMDHLAILYEREVDSMTKNLSTMLEPLLLVFMGVLVGGVAVSIILPIYQLPNLIQS